MQKKRFNAPENGMIHVSPSFFLYWVSCKPVMIVPVWGKDQGLAEAEETDDDQLHSRRKTSGRGCALRQVYAVASLQGGFPAPCPPECCHCRLRI